MEKESGQVWLVGAGPGDPELLTLRAVRALQAAQAVVYDRLVSEGVLALIPADAERFFAGKSCKQKAMTQVEINDLLIRLARQGMRVVRLKGGDPFFFGRGGEEALALCAAGIGFEVVPGITSAQGCAAAAGIPLTHRGLATGVRYITGHRNTEDEAALPLEMNWPSLADADTTLVVYMGLANLSLIAQKLMEHGLSAQTPTAAIAHGTTPAQRVCRAPLSEIAGLVVQQKLESPVLVIIGQAVSVADRLGVAITQPVDIYSDSAQIFTKMSY